MLVQEIHTVRDALAGAEETVKAVFGRLDAQHVDLAIKLGPAFLDDHAGFFAVDLALDRVFDGDGLSAEEADFGRSVVRRRLGDHFEELPVTLGGFTFSTQVVGHILLVDLTANRCGRVDVERELLVLEEAVGEKHGLLLGLGHIEGIEVVHLDVPPPGNADARYLHGLEFFGDDLRLERHGRARLAEGPERSGEQGD